MLDRYQWGDAERISPEAPVPVVKIRNEETRLGGAANVVHNLVSLGCQAGLCGVAGSDSAGSEVIERLQALGADAGGVLTDPSRPTTVKMRVMAHNQQLIRCDWENAAPLDADMEVKTIAWLERHLPAYDGVIVSDYGKGFLTSAVLKTLLEACSKLGKVAVVDPKGSEYGRYRGATCLTPNESEAASVIASLSAPVSATEASTEASTGASTEASTGAGSSLDTVEKALQAARELRDALQTEHFCITLGAKGVLALAASGEHRQFPARAREVYDVTGAGDTFISVLGALLIAGVDFFEAVDMANLGAGIVVGKVGTATVTPSEMLGFAAGGRKLFTLEEIGPLAESLRGQGRRVVFTNGCFDLLHAGHIQYLEASRAQGDALVVGINSDASVKRLKGEGRPLIGEEDRAHLLAALSCVDYVVVFEEDTPESLLRAVRPAVLTKGADYTVETVVGHDLVPQWGGEVVLIPLKENRSTSGLIDRIRAGQG